MKYAIYDKAADGYLVDMDFTTDIPDTALGLSCKYNEHITEAKLLDIKETAIDAVTSIEGYKFMEKGRFVIHSFDDTLNDQYIISEAGNPTKVVDNITVDLDGTVNVKYGTMAYHWSATSLEHAINRMDALQKAVSAIYTPWNNTFMVYKVITIMDEKEHTHYQFINVTNEGIEKYSKDDDERLLDSGKEINDLLYPLSKRIEELEKSNYELGEHVAERGSVANRLLDENNSLKAKVEHIKKEAHDWKKLYEKANKDREVLTNVIDNIYDDLNSADICKGLRETYHYIKSLSELNYINIHNDNTYNGEPIYITAAVEFKFIISKIIDVIESREGEAQKYIDMNLSIWKKKWADEVKERNKLRVARDCTASIICAIRNAIYSNDSDDFSCIEDRMKFDSDFNSDPFMVGVRENIKDICYAAKINLELKELYKKELSDWKLRTEEAIRDYTRCNEALGEWKRKCNAKDTDYEMLKNKLEACEIVLDSTHDLLIVSTKEKDKAIERAEFYKIQANSVYGMTVPTRCCGKQLMADILSGKKIPIDKKKYDALVEYVDNLNLTYDTVFCMEDKPIYLSTITEYINDLTK